MQNFFAYPVYGRENVYKVREELQQALMDGCFVFRNGKDLEKCVTILKGTLERSRHVGLVSNGIGPDPELTAALRIQGQVKLGLMIAQSALARTESRGSHCREDYQARDDRNWLNRPLAYWREGANMPELAYEDASAVFELPPGERGYGGGKIIPADPEMVASRTVQK